MEILIHLQDHAFQYNDYALIADCRELMGLAQSPSPYPIVPTHDHAGDDNNRPKTENIPDIEPPYDDSLDSIFDKCVNPEKVKRALDGITTLDKHKHPFWFITMKVLVYLRWVPTTTTTKDFLRWASLQYDLGWTTDRQLSFSEIGGDKATKKVIKDTDITLWNHISDRVFRDIQKYRNFSILVKKTFVHVIVDGKEPTYVTDFNVGKFFDRAEFMKKANELINDKK